MISQKSISELANKVDILTVAQRYARGKLVKSGASYKCLSPFTKEKTPSCYFHVDKQYFKDFSSGKGGDTIDFVKEIEGVGYLDAIHILADMFGVKLIEVKDEGQKFGYSEFVPIMDKAFVDALKNNPVALEYVVNRFGAKAVKKFGLGFYVPEINMDVKKEMGLLRKWDNAEMMRGRVLFPIKTKTGKVVSYFARAMDDSKSKYIGGHNTDFYKKSETLYGLRENSLDIQKENLGYLVEGHPDVITMFAHSYPALASMGTSMSDNQINQCLRLTKNWVVLFDGDDAGERAAIKTIESFAERGVEVRASSLDGQDPDEHLKVNGKLNVEPKSGFDYLMERTERGHALDVMWNYLTVIKEANPLKSTYAYTDLAERYGLNKNVFDIKWKKSVDEPSFSTKTIGIKNRWDAIANAQT